MSHPESDEGITVPIYYLNAGGSNPRHIEITDEDCPLGTVYRLNASYARTVSKWAEHMTSETMTVLVRHPSTDKHDVPVFDSTLGLG